MWWSDRRRLILGLAALPLAGCGFTPALAPGTAAAGVRGRIRADDPGSDAGLAFVTRFEERMGPPAAVDWHLSWSLSISTERRGLVPGLGDSRGQMTGRLRWSLTPADGGAPVAGGQAERFVGYSRSASPLAIRSAAEDARRRVAELLAEAVAAELIATARDWAT
ncbi:MAG: LPS assembly lipoprotein LptE [Alkalilacustris sp.]